MLPSGDVRRCAHPARKQKRGGLELGSADLRIPRQKRFSRMFSDLKRNRAGRFPLHDDRTRGYSVALSNIAYAQPHEVAGAELAADRQIEESQASGPMGELKAGSDRPKHFQLERRLLADQFALVPRYRTLSLRFGSRFC